MKKNRVIVIFIVLLSIVCILITSGFIYLMVNEFNFNTSFNFSNNKKMNLINSYETLLSNVESINFKLYSTDIEIKKSINDKVLVEYYSNLEDNIEIIYVDNAIKIDEEKDNLSCVGFCSLSRKIVLYIPNDYMGKFDFKTTSGDIISELDYFNNEISISTTSGDVEFNDIRDINILTTSGDIKIANVREKINLQTTSGDIIISNMVIKDNSNITTTSGDVKINNSGSDCYFDIKTISGDQCVKNNNRKSDYVLSISTTSGDIIVN